MLLDKSLAVALLFSTLFHAVFFLPIPAFKGPLIKKTAPLKITYIVQKKPSSQRVQIKEELPVKFKAQPKKRIVSIPKKTAQRTKIEVLNKLAKEKEKEKEKLYLDYCQYVHEKVRKYIEDNCPYYVAGGEVRLHFVILSDGRLKEIEIVEERSTHVRLLKEIVRKSVRQAAPFSPLPKELNQTQQAFNVTVSFVMED